MLMPARPTNHNMSSNWESYVAGRRAQLHTIVVVGIIVVILYSASLLMVAPVVLVGVADANP